MKIRAVWGGEREKIGKRTGQTTKSGAQVGTASLKRSGRKKPKFGEQSGGTEGGACGSVAKLWRRRGLGTSTEDKALNPLNFPSEPAGAQKQRTVIGPGARP